MNIAHAKVELPTCTKSHPLSIYSILEHSVRAISYIRFPHSLSGMIDSNLTKGGRDYKVNIIDCKYKVTCSIAPRKSYLVSLFTPNLLDRWTNSEIM